MRVELIYDDDCPNADGARELLKTTMNALRLDPNWNEHCRQDPDAPAYAQKFGSPTILVNGEDVAPVTGQAGNACRIYQDADGRMSGLPPRENLIRALKDRTGNGTVGGATIFTALLAGVASLLPAVTCAACWPAYGALLAGLGIGFVNYTPYLFPVLVVFVALALFGLYYRANSRNGYGPLALGIVAAPIMVIAHLWFQSNTILYAGAALLSVAAIWNIWPRRNRTKSGRTDPDPCNC